MTNYDVIVIGSGPGGYVSAIRCAQLGLKTAIVEGRDTLGGTCLNVGCIPSKALLHASHSYHEATHNFDKMGLIINNPKIDFDKMQNYKNDVISQNTKGIEFLLKKNKIDVLMGNAAITAKNTVTVETDKGMKKLKGQNIILATGARARELPGLEADGDLVWTYKAALTPKRMPKKLLVIGSGAIGIEFASFYNTLGADTTVVEVMDHILPIEDEEISLFAKKSFIKQGMKIIEKATVKKLDRLKGKVVAHIEINSKIEKQEFDTVISAVGIVGNIENIGLETLNIKEERSHVVTDKFCRTNVEGVFAIGDLAAPPWLAHKASHEGVMVAELIAGKNPHSIKPESIAGCTYCYPQIASVGYTEAKAIEKGFDIKVGRFPFIGNGKAIALGETEGLVKTIFDAKNGELLGAHMVGAEVTEMIQGYVVSRQLETTEQDLMNTVFPHPTLSEMMHESVLDAYGQAIHI